ncbi:isoprenylcysteine carboxylmethyltransferase family protein [Kineosporia sp. R_H_3]|uniref:methyltransferase family protein n=1 Tax=Kineosporia sp. R_H_3 TaxID=1961848 RepID=UPI001304036B|nr:isoprenylcysteine carboxylmethyltransferase family protein [Kineosporia sp. R_H_3]
MSGTERPRRPAADLLVLAQGLAAAGLLWPGRARWRLPRPVTVACMAAGVAGTALAEEGVRFLGRDLTPFVDPKDGAHLQTAGPYEISRNPVYAGLLVAGAAFAVLRRRPEPLVAFAALAAVLHVKSGVEEQRLRDRFGEEYEVYAARTPRLVGLPRPVAARPAIASIGREDHDR